MSVFTTEITSDKIPSDNPIHQRLFKAYIAAKGYVKGDVLELGCGEGRGIAEIAPLATSYAAIDKIKDIIDTLQAKYPAYQFRAGHFPPVPYEDAQFDTIVTFQVIEHIKNDRLFLQEIYRMLKPGGLALISTPNRLMSLSRNPWHIREYTAAELTSLCEAYFDDVKIMGIGGNEKVMAYHEQNRQSVARITRLDILKLQYRLPAAMLRFPYEILNRINRNKLKKQDDDLVSSISHQDYLLNEMDDQNLDLFVIVRKKSL